MLYEEATASNPFREGQNKREQLFPYTNSFGNGQTFKIHVCYEFPDFRAFQVAKFILPQQKQNTLSSNQGKEGSACSWVSGKADMQIEGWRRAVHKASFRETYGFENFCCEMRSTKDTPGQCAQL